MTALENSRWYPYLAVVEIEEKKENPLREDFHYHYKQSKIICIYPTDKKQQSRLSYFFDRKKVDWDGFFCRRICAYWTIKTC